MRQFFLILHFLSIAILLCPDAPAQQPKLILPIGHNSYINGVEFSADGKTIATASWDQTIKIWDVASGLLLSTIYTGVSELNTVHFSPDGSKVFALSFEKKLKIFGVEDGKLKLTLTGHINTIWAGNFSHDGKRIVTSLADKSVIIWNSENGEKLLRLMGHKKEVTDVLFSPDDKIILSKDDSTIRLWDSKSGKLINTLVGQVNLNSRIFSNDGKRILFRRGSEIIEFNLKNGVIENKIILADTIQSITYNLFSDKALIHTQNGECKVVNLISGKNEIELAGKINYPNPFYSPNDLFISDDGFLSSVLRVWDAKTGKLLFSKKAYSGSNEAHIYGIKFSPDSRYIVTISNDYSGNGQALIWDTKKGDIIHSLKYDLPNIIELIPTNSNNNIISFYEGGLSKWDINRGSVAEELVIDTRDIVTQRIFPDQNKIVIVNYRNFIETLNEQTGQLTSRVLMRGRGEKLNSSKVRVAMPFKNVRLSNDGKFVSTMNANEAAVWDVHSGEQIFAFRSDISLNSAILSQDSKKLILCLRDSTVKVIDIDSRNIEKSLRLSASGDKIFASPDKNFVFITLSFYATGILWNITNDSWIIIKGHNGIITSAEFSGNSKRLVTCSYDQSTKIWDTESGQLILSLGDSSGMIKKAFFTDNDRKIVTFSENNLCAVWNAANGCKLYTFYIREKSKNLILLPSGYYFCSPELAKSFHYVSKDFKIITFESLDVKFNRPDIVFETIGLKDTGLISSYRNAYYKRIKKLGVDTGSFREGYSVPEADFLNRDSIDFEQTRETLRLRIHGSDSSFLLDRFNIWVNEVPVFGMKGISIHRRRSRSFDTTVLVTLSRGENQIETSVTNVNGTESYRIPLKVLFNPPKPQPENTLFIGIGINRYADSNYNLTWSVKDIRDLALRFREKYQEQIQIDTLFDQQVTLENVLALRKSIEKLGVNDRLIIAFSGHGLLSKDYDYYLGTYRVDFEKPEENGLPYDALESLLDNIKPRKKLLLIDACHSGEVDKDDIAFSQAASDSSLPGLRFSRGGKLSTSGTNKPRLGMKSSFELMQQLFVNVSKGTGATVISAASGNQLAYEKGELQNGIFTYAILEAMTRFPHLRISELKNIVAARVTELTHGAQQPTFRTEMLAADWFCW